MSQSGGGARTLALGTAENRPAWLRPTAGERRWGSAGTLLVVIGLQFLLPGRLVVHPAYVMPTLELFLLAVLTFSHPERLSRRSRRSRTLAQVLVVAVAATNTVSLGLLVGQLVGGRQPTPTLLLVGGGTIWLTNTVVFALWYWEYDRGGPAARAHGMNDHPDLLYPQMTDEHLAYDWEPTFADYLYVSFTNSTAFSPTDTMPLSRWCKLLFAVQAAVSLITVALVAARAVNILPGL